MGRLVRDARLETREARRRLKTQKEPHWRLIVEGVHLGYYKGANGGMWYARVRREKKYYWEALAKADDNLNSTGGDILDYAQAQEKAKAFAEKILNHDNHKDIKEYTVKNATDEYLADFKANGKKSLYVTENGINAHILPHFENKVVSILTFRELNAWKNKLATTEKRLRSSKITRIQKYIPNDNSDPDYQRKRRATANRIITIFKAILNHAYNTARVPSDKEWKKLKPFKNVSEPKIRFLTESEITRLINACDTNFRMLVRGALLTGARYGELKALKIGDYNSNNHTIFIQDSKSGKPRNIPLNQEGVKFFEQLIIGKSASEFMFTRADGKKWGTSHQVRPMAAACEIAKIAPAINFHILRHTYGSSLAMRGVPLQVIAAALGHSDTRITHKHYAHLMPSYIADVIREHLPNFGETETSNVSQINQKAINT